ncbi:MAG: molybdopterin molybdotransferase MoeA [Anaerolineae bacterium]|nr:molybdopterin molybdotransferase MoeA [Anaerolineae bacterium]
MNLLSVEEARTRMLSHFQPKGTEAIPLEKGLHRVLAINVKAQNNLPSFDNSSMDGFALIAEDIETATPASPRTLNVVADIPAGTNPNIVLQSGQAARIMTGAPMPKGADVVIPVEETDFQDRSPGTSAPKKVSIYKSLAAGTFVREQGMDVRTGQSVLSSGHKLRPQDLGLLGMLGVANVEVYQTPRVALLSSGDELVPVDAELKPGMIRNSNSYMLSALLETSGSEVLNLGIAKDTRKSVEEILAAAAAQNVDMILSSAGVSVGAFDYLKDVVEAQGELSFWRVNMRPGKPLAFGKYKGIPFIGLPGNPVSAFVGFEVFVRPVLEKLSGLIGKNRLKVRVQLDEALSSDGRESYLRAIVHEANGKFSAQLTGHQGSGNLFSTVQANALLIIPAGIKSLEPGAEVDAWLLD